MCAADAVMVPLQCEFFALEGLSQLLKTIDLVRASLNPSLEIQGIVLTMFDKRNKLSDQAGGRDVRENMGENDYTSVIPRNVRVSEAPSHGVPALVYDLRCPGSQVSIKLLAGELIQREKIRGRGMTPKEEPLPRIGPGPVRPGSAMKIFRSGPKRPRRRAACLWRSSSPANSSRANISARKSLASSGGSR